MTAGNSAAGRRSAWIAAVGGRDVDAYAAIVSDDVVWFPPVGDPLQGRAAFRRWVEPLMGSFWYELTLEPTTSNEAGDWAYETGTFRSIMEPVGGGTAMEHDGRYFVLWRKEDDGTWRIERYVDLGGAN